MNTVIFRIFEFLINVFQSFAVTHYLIKCFGTKSKDEKPFVEYIAGFMVTLIYLEVLSRITAFENIWVFAYLAISIFYSIVLLDGKIIEKIFFNLLMIVAIVFSSMTGAGLVSLICGEAYENLIYTKILPRYVAAVIVQIILCLVLYSIVKLKKMLQKTDYRYMGALSIIPVISVVVCCVLFFNEHMTYQTRLIITFTGIVIINVTSFLLLVMEHNLYMKHIQEKSIINAYEQKEKDVNAIKMMKIELDKLQHDNKKIYLILSELLKQNEYEKAEDFLKQYIDEKQIKKSTSLYSDNIILNYLLTRKVSQCEDIGITMKCFVCGRVQGITDVDLYILLENLIDNAMEASGNSEDKRIDFKMYIEQEEISIEIGNSVREDVIKNNPKMITTKKDSEKHGYGLQNVNDVVKKYLGTIHYEMKTDNYFTCRIRLKKK